LDIIPGDEGSVNMARTAAPAWYAAAIGAALLFSACGSATTGVPLPTSAGGIHVNLQCQTCSNGPHPTATGSLAPAPSPAASLNCDCYNEGSITISRGTDWSISITDTGTAALVIQGLARSFTGSGKNWSGTTTCQAVYPASTVVIKPGASCTEDQFYTGYDYSTNYDNNDVSELVNWYTNAGTVSFTWIGQP
jgi:hypothetical protein